MVKEITYQSILTSLDTVQWFYGRGINFSDCEVGKRTKQVGSTGGNEGVFDTRSPWFKSCFGNFSLSNFFYKNGPFSASLFFEQFLQ